MNKVVEFKLKDKKPNQVYEHECGSQLWFIEDLPGGKLPSGEGYDNRVMIRCAGCCKLVDVKELLSNTEDEE